MADRDGVILQLYSRARAPNRDYYGLTISNEEVVLNIWNITHGPHVFPRKQKCPLGDLQIAKSLVSEIHRLFGRHVVDYCLALDRGDARLECIPTKVFLKILRSLAVSDILKLGQTSKIFFELCNRNDVWGVIFAKRNKGKPSRDEVKAANQKGWKTVLKNKLVWSGTVNRSQNQKQFTSKAKLEATKPPVNKPVAKKPEVKSAVPPRPDLNKVQKVEKLAGGANVKPKADITTTNNLNDIANIVDITKVIKESKPLPVNAVPVARAPPKGILKKSSSAGAFKTSSKLLNFSEKLENIPEQSPMTTIDYAPMPKQKSFPINSSPSRKSARTSLDTLLNRFLSKDVREPVKSAKDRHLDRFLDHLDKEIEKNPYKLDPKLVETPHRSTSCTATNKFGSHGTINKSSTKPPTRPKVVDFLSRPTPNDKTSPDKMTSKFEDYLNSLKGRSVHPSVEISPRKSAMTLSRTDLIPKISELTRSINNIRSSFYNPEKFKMKLNANLNNTKVANGHGCSQQLNNKLNVTPTTVSTSALEIKKNVLRTHSKSAAAKTLQPKVKNTNCVMNTNQAGSTFKPKSMPKVTKSANNVKAKNK